MSFHNTMWPLIVGPALAAAAVYANRRRQRGKYAGPDFDAVVNAEWKRDNPIPADQTRWMAFVQMKKRSNACVREIIDPMKCDSNQRPTLYESATSWGLTLVENTAARDPMLYHLYILHQTMPDCVPNKLRELLRATRETGSLSELVALHAKHLMASGVSPIVHVYASAHPTQPDRNVPYLCPTGYALPARSFYLNDDKHETRRKYVKYMTSTIALFNELLPADERLTIDPAGVLATETAFAERRLGGEEKRDVSRASHLVADLAGVLAGSPFETFLTDAGVPAAAQQEVVLRGDAAYFEQFLHTLGTEGGPLDMEHLRQLTLWHTVHTYAEFLSQDLFDEAFAFDGVHMTGQQQPRAAEERAVKAIEAKLGEYISKEYVARHFPPEAKGKCLALVDDIRDAMRARLLDRTHFGWMSVQARAAALQKLEAMRLKIGYPDRFTKPYSLLCWDVCGSWAEFMLEWSRWDWEHLELPKMGQARDPDEWHLAPHSINAYYDFTSNTMVFPAGILQDPVYNQFAPDAVNMGRIGTIVGHELTHAFDDQGRKYDATGALVEDALWTEADVVEFERRKAKIVAQFAAYTAVCDVHLKGDLVCGENIADIGGVRLAYAAWHNRQDPRNVLVRAWDYVTAADIRREQSFFLAYAELWRANVRDEMALKLAEVDPHSPPRLRINGILCHVDEFHRAFGIDEPHPMYLAPDDRCDIW